MEINITKLFQNIDAPTCSGSVAELGNNAGAITWNNSLSEAKDHAYMLDTDEKKQAFRDHIRGFGAWDDEEISAWSDHELTALFVQLVAGDMRESGLDDCHWSEIDWEAYEEGAQEGRYSGNIFKGDDEQIYYSLGY